MDSLIVNKIDAYIKANRDSIIRDLTGLVRTPSVTGEPSDGAPYGADCRNMLDVVCTLFKENGFDAEVCPGDRYALSYFGEGEKTIALFSHSDVVPVADDWIFTTPFDPIEKDGFLIGRGIEDNKAGITICLHLMKMLRELEIPMKNRVMTFVGSCEETGMEDIKYFAREQKKCPSCALSQTTHFP